MCSKKHIKHDSGQNENKTTKKIIAVDCTRHYKGRVRRAGRKGVLKSLMISFVNHVDGWRPVRKRKKKRKKLYRRNAGKCDQICLQGRHTNEQAFSIATRMNDRKLNRRLLFRHDDKSNSIRTRRRVRVFALCPHEPFYNSMSRTREIQDLDIKFSWAYIQILFFNMYLTIVVLIRQCAKSRVENKQNSSLKCSCFAHISKSKFLVES